MSGARQHGRSRLTVAKEWWNGLLREVVICAAGVFVLLWQTIVEAGDRPYLIAAGCALAGVPLVGAAQRALRRSEEEDAR
jgi:hypothetical protein